MRRTVTLITALCLLLSMASCTKKTAAGDNGTDNSAPTTITVQSDAPSGSTKESSGSEAETLGVKDMSFEDMYGTQISDFLGHQYYFNGQKVSKALMDYRIIDTYVSLSSYASYGYYPSIEGGYLDMYATYPGPEYATYGAFVIDYSEQLVLSQMIILEKAHSQGVTLPKEYTDDIDSFLSNLQDNICVSEGVTPDEIAALLYGENTDFATLREVLTENALTEYYTTYYIEHYEFSDDEIMKPSVRYTLFSAPEGSSQEVLDSQKALAESLRDDCDGSLDALTVIGATMITNGSAVQSSDITVYGQTVSAFEEWANDPARKEGDIDVIYAPGYGYFTVGYLGLVEVDDSVKSSIAVEVMQDEIDEEIKSGKYDFHTDEEYPLTPTHNDVDPDQTESSSTEPAASVTETTAPSASEMTSAPSAKEDNGQGKDGKSSSEIIILALAAVGGIAILGAAIFGVAALMRKFSSDDAQDEDQQGEDHQNETEV